MKITDLKSLKEQNAALQAAIAEAIKPFGLTMERQTGSIDARGGKLTLSLTTTFLPEGIENQEELDRANWTKHAKMLGLPEDAFGLTVIFGGVKFTLVGLDPGRPKNCVKMRRVSDGKAFCSTADQVVFQLAKTAAIASHTA